MTRILNTHKINSPWLTVSTKWSVNQKIHILLKTANTDRVCKQGYKTRVNLGVSCCVVRGVRGGSIKWQRYSWERRPINCIRGIREWRHEWLTLIRERQTDRQTVGLTGSQLIRVRVSPVSDLGGAGQGSPGVICVIGVDDVDETMSVGQITVKITLLCVVGMIHRNAYGHVYLCKQHLHVVSRGLRWIHGRKG